MRKSELQKAIAKVAPSICIRTIWEHDPDCGPISKECDGFSPEDDDEWQAWQSEVRATAIVDGEEVSGSDYLGCTFEKVGDVPEENNPTISGYETDMTERALDELASLISDPETLAEIEAAKAVIAAARE